MKRQVMAGVLMLVACGTTAATPPPGGDNTVTASGRIVWKDASGSLVARDQLFHMDERGHAWPLDPETGGRLDMGPHAVYFAQTGCAGPGYATASPRIPIKLAGETAWKVRPDSAQSQTVAVLSQRNAAGTCSALSLSLRLVPVAQLVVGPLEPSFSYAPPLHMERE